MIVRATICHIITFWASDFVAGEVCRRKELDFCYDDGLVTRCGSIRGGIFELIRGYKECIRRRMEDASLVEVGRAIVFDETLEGRVRTEDRQKRIVVNQERLRLRSGG